jgi:hypothetical protein
MISAKVGVRFDAGALGVHYHSTFWGNTTGVPRRYTKEILNDFLDGIHPMTDGSPKKGTPALVIQDGVSADTLLNRYLKVYVKKMERLVNMYFTISL